MSRRLRSAIVLAASSALVLAGCAGGGGGSQDPTSPADSSSKPAAASGAVGFDQAESATVQIEAVGTFESPGEGAFEGAGRGSGFIVDPSGLAVTNNHVVVGAGTLKVWVEGEEYNAALLGASECLDLAVIDIEGDGFPYFDWDTEPVASAQEVWAVGFPLGDPVFTITGGIVSKTDTTGDTAWASLEHTIEHDARIRPGNSGGPLIQADGKVVGVNYAGDDTNDINLAISQSEVEAVFASLAKGRDVLGLGINGQAWLAEDGSASGIFVASVASGSPADTAGVVAGDLVTRMEGVTLATDGTMADYCSVLRTHGVDATLSLEVYRPSDGGTYLGQVNGDELELVALPQADGGDGGTDSGTGATGGDFYTVTDDAGVISVDVPVEWTQVDGTQVTDEDGSLVYDVSASTNLQAFYEGWEVAGVSVSASTDWLAGQSVATLLDRMAAVAQSGGCTALESRTDYADGYYSGQYDWWEGCGGVGTDYVVIAAGADDGSHMILVRIQLAGGDYLPLDGIAASFFAAF